MTRRLLEAGALVAAAAVGAAGMHFIPKAFNKNGKSDGKKKSKDK